MEVRIETKYLLLRKIELRYKDIFHKIRNEEHILKWMSDWKSTEMLTK